MTLCGKKIVMKKTAILTAILLATFLLASCGKEEPVVPQTDDTVTPALPEYAQLILGRWDAVLDKCYESYIEGDYDETTYASDWAVSLSLIFSDQGTLSYSANLGDYEDGWDDSYAIHGDTLVWDVKPYKILTLDEHSLVFQYEHSEQRTTAGGTVITTTVVKRYELTR